MNRSTLLVFLCVFALSEVLLAAGLGRIRGFAPMMKLERHEPYCAPYCAPCALRCGCATESECYEVRKNFRKNAGIFTFGLWNGGYCREGLKPFTEKSCARACKSFGVRSGEVSEDGMNCHCNENVCITSF
ncbi:hypothetical protein DdX_18095 [Ditylenchus destructor]|uniref:Uncharacterized protein n=1 Tax=Ditylenchus destructor TaxID=166010 RepID=A0AAD4QYE5_9BILA|nr:hypothetical protein DdX_18095 [Ditylenchus destructor]